MSRNFWGWVGTISWWLGLLLVLAALVFLYLAVRRPDKPEPPKALATVILYDDGKEIGRWSTEQYKCSSDCSSINFVDDKTGDTIRIHGTYVTIIPKPEEK